MNSIFILLFCFIVIIITTDGAPTDSISDSNNDPVTEIYDFWKEQEKSFHLDERKDVILLLGNTGSGKSTTALFVTDAKLNAVAPKSLEDVVDSNVSETSDSDDDYSESIESDVKDANVDTVNLDTIFITDPNNKIGNETMNSYTLIPDLYTDNTGAVYYDCPGFGDTREPKYELTVAFFLNKLMNYADSFKLLFVIDHSSVRSHGERKGFKSLVKDTMKLIKHIGNYTRGIGMVVTKVQSDTSDSKVIDQVAEFLKEARNSFANENSEEKDDSLNFIDGLLQKSRKSKRYTKIAIFRRPQEVKTLNNINKLNEERDRLKKMIKRLKYVPKMDDDFGIVISPESREYIGDLTKKIIDDGFVSDMANIRREIKQFYIKQENLRSDISELYEQLTLGVELFSIIRTEDPRQFMKEILNATYVLNIDISNDTVDPILRHIESIDFLLTVVNQTLSNQLIHEVTNIVNHLKNSQNWYGFLMDFNVELTKIAFQNEGTKEVARKISEDLMTISEGKTSIKFGDLGLDPLLTKIENIKIQYKNEISEIQTSNLNALRNILTEFSNDKLNTTCPQNELKEYNMEVRGHIIKMSDVVNHTCYAKSKNIKIFALNKLIVDENINKTGQQAQIVIIAPTWEIIERKSFILDGKNAENHEKAYAAHGIGGKDQPHNGDPGKPGKAGSAGGNFFAIGSKFLLGDHLTIQVNGGNGGAGQHGGNGTHGIKGDSPPAVYDFNSFIENQWVDNGFKFNESKTMPVVYVVFGKDGTKPGDGGNGGKRGNPGLPGTIMLFELNEASNLGVQTKIGTPGAIGKGGHGGNGTHNGQTKQVSTISHPGSAGPKGATPGWTSIDIQKVTPGGRIDKGKDGKDNEAVEAMEEAKPPREFNHPLLVVNEYKSFAREHSIGSSRQIEINNFLNKITNNENIKAKYGALELINEFTTMEDQYFKMRGKMDFVPLLESLLRRTKEFKPTETHDKRALVYLYTAILSKINGIKNKVYKNTVYDLEKFLNEVNENINELQDSIKQNNMIMVRNDFNASLSEKMRSAENFIKNEIKPVIEDTFKEIEEQIKTLITLSIKKQNDTIENIAAQRMARKNLEANIRLRYMLAPMKIIATAATVFSGPVGAAVGTVVNSGTSVIETFAIKNEKGITKAYSPVSTAFKSGMTAVGDVLKERPKLIQQKINDIDEYIEKELKKDEAEATTTTTPTTPTEYPSSHEIETLKRQLNTSRAEIGVLNEQLTERVSKEEGNTKFPKDLTRKCDKIEKDIEETTKELEKGLKKRKAGLSEEKEQQQKTLDKYLGIMSRVQNIVKVVDVSIDTYKEIIADEEKLQAFAAVIGGLESDLEVLKDHERKIHSVLMPQIDEIQNNIDDTTENLKGSSHVELDVKKWQIRGTFSKVRQLFDKMTREFSVHDSLRTCVDTLDEGMATVINIYDRIDSYLDTAKLAAYIENIASSESSEMAIGDPELSDAVSKLRQMIRSNIVLEEYEMAKHAFKQHYFPIVNTFLPDYLDQLPTNLKMYDTTAIVDKSVGEVKKLIDSVQSSKSIWYEYKESIQYSDFDDNSRSQEPFFVWKHHEIKDQIPKLLRGDEISLKADVTRGVNLNAIKFNEIGIYFKPHNDARSKGLTTELYNHFNVIMKMVGNNYYRCNNRYYQIPLDHDIVFKFAYENGTTDSVANSNEWNADIRGKEPFLSPFVMWTIKLDKIQHKYNFDGLEQFVNHDFDLELIGSGKFLVHGKYSNEICNENLDKYYSYDRTISNVDTLIP